MGFLRGVVIPYLNLATLEYSRCHGRANHKKNAAAASTRSYRSMYKTCGKHDRPAVLRPRGCRRGRKLPVALAGTPARKNSAFPRRVSATIAKWNYRPASRRCWTQCICHDGRLSRPHLAWSLAQSGHPAAWLPGDSDTPNPRRPLRQWHSEWLVLGYGLSTQNPYTA